MKDSHIEKDAVARICRYAKTIGKLDSVEVLGFVDNNKSVDSLVELIFTESSRHPVARIQVGQYLLCF